ncbi:MAG: SsrA-binding protein SmpB [bacterium]
MKILAKNRRAKFDYHLKEFFEAGIVLTGQETKSTKGGNISLKGSYVTLHPVKGKPGYMEAFLLNAHISPYKHAGELPDYDPVRTRKLLLKKAEIRKLIGKKQAEGLTIVPTKVYTKRRKIKVEIALARGKKQYDKREGIKQRQDDRAAERELRGKI